MEFARYVKRRNETAEPKNSLLLRHPNVLRWGSIVLFPYVYSLLVPLGSD